MTGDQRPARPITAFYTRQAPALRSAFATTLACEIALIIVMALHLPNPAWALITVIVLATPTAGSSVQKAMLRVVGTAVGAGLALMLITWFDQAPLAFSIALFLLCMVAAYGASGTRHPYAYLIASVTIGIIATQGLSSPGLAVDIAFARACEVGIGVATAVLVRLSVWPVRSSARLRAELAATLERGAELLTGAGRADRTAAAVALIRSRQQHQTFLLAADGESDLTRAQHRHYVQAVGRAGAIIDAVLAAEAIAAAAPAPLLTDARAALSRAMRRLEQALRGQRARGGAAIASEVAGLRITSPAGAGEVSASYGAALARALAMLARELGVLARLSDYLGPGGPAAPAEIGVPADTAGARARRGRIDRARLVHALKVAIVVVSALWLWMIFHLPGGMQGMVSAMIVAQRTVGATQVKSVQRLLGVLIGGTVGILIAASLMPGVGSLGVFGLLIAPVLFAGAWLNDGSPRYGYIGFQSNFAFILTLVAGSSPEPNAMAPVLRFCGILIGVATASIILRAIAPVDAWAASLRGLGGIVAAAGRALKETAPPGGTDERGALRDETAAFMAELRPGAARRGWPDWPLDALLAQASRLSALAGLVDARAGGELGVAAEQLAAVAQRLGSDVAHRRVRRGAGDLTALRAQLERVASDGSASALAQVGILQSAASLLGQIEQRLDAQPAAAALRPVPVSA